MRKKHFRLDRAGLGSLLRTLQSRGYHTYGPRIQDQAIQWLPVSTADDLPAGWTTENSPGAYRLTRTTDNFLFGFWTGQDSLKRFLHPPRACLTRIEMNGGLRASPTAPAAEKRAFLGVRACDLAAVAALDRVLLGDQFVDETYKANREACLLIGVNCTASGNTCFCASMNTGPQVKSGCDIVLTEREGGDFLAQPLTTLGAGILEEAGATPSPAEWPAQAAEACARAGAAQTRAVNPESAKPALERNFEHPRWEQTARRCFNCGNCTSVCPTCFCVNVEDTSSLDGHSAERWRAWDSCFTQNFSYIHGGSIRLTPKSRYRQWLSHKFARWQDQFGTPGCVGCGRCIGWCPAGIDVTEEVAALEGAAQGGSRGD
jgi:formate hydrogenlyase subunit 6/NADH:ubiquinone oxidoreductase subunit I